MIAALAAKPWKTMATGAEGFTGPSTRAGVRQPSPRTTDSSAGLARENPQTPARHNSVPSQIWSQLESRFNPLNPRMVELHVDPFRWNPGYRLGKVVREDELYEQVAAARHAGRRIVFTNGCFDLLHPGHIRSLEQARSLGDGLVVAVNSDRSVREYKGSGRPLVPENERAELLAALAAVDWVVIFDDPTPQRLIARLLPDILVKGADWAQDDIAGRAEVEASGGRVVRVPVVDGYSTSEIVQRILSENR
jgi:D-glycero-beta-D-manno-heptose 1-phosphate adenylyltransferase